MPRQYMPFTMLPPENPLIEVAKKIGISPVFQYYLEPFAQIPPIPSDSTVIPIVSLPQSQSSSNAHKYRLKLNKTFSSDQFLIIREPPSIMDAIKAIKHPDINLLLIRIKELPNLLTKEVSTLIQSYQKPILIDLSNLMYPGFQRIRIIYHVLRVHQRIRQKMLYIPITMPTANEPFLLRDPSSIMALLQLLQFPIENYSLKVKKILSNLYDQLSPNTERPKTELVLEFPQTDTEDSATPQDPSRLSYPLPPIWRSSPRIARRYLAYRLHFIGKDEIHFDESQIQNTLNHLFRALYGEITSVHTHIRVIKYESKSNILLLRTTPITVSHLSLLMALLTNIKEVPVVPQLIGRSGTIQSISKNFPGLLNKK